MLVTFNITYYAVLRETAGIQDEAVALPDGATGRMLFEVLRERHPALAELLPFVRIATEDQYLNTEDALPHGKKLLLIPPVSGG